MALKVLIMPSAERDLRHMDVATARRVLSKLRSVETAGRLVGDVKRLTGRPPRYRLRVGDYRILFTVGEDTIRVYRIAHRREAYD
jgi:mRNA interferase RelE/StbE